MNDLHADAAEFSKMATDAAAAGREDVAALALQGLISVVEQSRCEAQIAVLTLRRDLALRGIAA